MSRLRLKGDKFSLRLRGSWPGEFTDERQKGLVLVIITIDGRRYETLVLVKDKETRSGFILRRR